MVSTGITSVSYRLERFLAVFVVVSLISHKNNGFVRSLSPPKGQNSVSTKLHMSLPLPFFASSSATEKVKEGRASITDRLPIGKLFDSRDYIFNTASNVRGYEWTIKETEELVDDLLDACSGALAMGESRQDYELSQIVLIPMEWDQDALGLGSRYDVHDGQQRLVTLSLLFASMRERFQQLEGMEDTVTELAEMLKPPKTRKEEILRVEMNPRDNVILTNILSSNTNMVSKLANATTQELSKLSTPNQRIVQNYNHIASRMQTLEKDELLELLDFIIEKVYLLVCVPESAAIARNIVMGQGKGKDHEIIDDFKGLVCYRYTPEEKEMYKAFDAWDAMSSSVIDLEAGVVGRKTVSDACLMRATTSLKQKIASRKQLLALEQWLRKEMEAKSIVGSEFYNTEIQPASLVLGQFREGVLQPFGFSKSGKIMKSWPSIELRLNFLREMIQGIPATKEVEMVVLDLGLRAGGGGGNKALTLDKVERYLGAAEQLVLYFALVRPTAREKYEKCFALLEAIDTEISRGSSSSGKLGVLNEDDTLAMYTAISLNSLGSNAAGKRLCLALLKRLNTSVLLQRDPEKANGDSAEAIAPSACYLEPVLPNKATKKGWGDVWPDKATRDVWTHRLGNQCLVSKPAPTKVIKLPFSEKKGRYAAELWPLTAKLCEREVWDDIAIKESSATIVGLMKSIWE
ncbi:unnamed protein product [Cylindrotheca closterium]|uniref:DUF262 domain-containing protein n=1 Tax=Cylindrotheca closterium TaxID=2856 RepID=A0AAD2PTX5_9STRA|nr:unnamed protein product [Cylindrotheca closterium]